MIGDHYRLDDQIAADGMGEVWQAIDLGYSERMAGIEGGRGKVHPTCIAFQALIIRNGSTRSIVRTPRLRPGPDEQDHGATQPAVAILDREPRLGPRGEHRRRHHRLDPPARPA
jgi:hypothetical protein